ncbi:MAG: hypothetical protein ACOVOS_02935, partial [Chitinophagaceae bacterium]
RFELVRDDLHKEGSALADIRGPDAIVVLLLEPGEGGLGLFGRVRYFRGLHFLYNINSLGKKVFGTRA